MIVSKFYLLRPAATRPESDPFNEEILPFLIEKGNAVVLPYHGDVDCQGDPRIAHYTVVSRLFVLDTRVPEVRYVMSFSGIVAAGDSYL